MGKADHNVRADRTPRGWPASVLLLAGLLLAGCAGPTYSRLREADEKLSSEATRALREDAVLARARLDARAYRGVVGLFGEVETAALSDRAAEAIRRLDGVRRINNLIVVAGDSSAVAPRSPAPGAVALVAAREAPAPTP